MDKITKSFNLFVDTSRGHNSESKGDDFIVNLHQVGVVAGEGEYIKMSLDNFSMAKNWSDVNDNNDEFRMKVTGTTNFTVNLKLKHQNNKSVHSLAGTFADAIRQGFADNVNGCETTADHTEVSPSGPGISTDNIISFVVNTTGNHGMTSGIIQFDSQICDSYALLGGDRQSYSTELPSVSFVKVTNTSVKVTCLYPAQISTTPFVYLRCPGLNTSNIESQGLRNTDVAHDSDVAHSNILGRCVVESQEWIQYTSQTSREFFLDLKQRSLTSLRLKLTDSHNRSLGRRNDSHGLSAGGTGVSQSSLGNLSFSAVLRFDIIKTQNVSGLETTPFAPSISARLSNIKLAGDNKTN